MRYLTARVVAFSFILLASAGVAKADLIVEVTGTIGSSTIQWSATGTGTISGGTHHYLDFNVVGEAIKATDEGSSSVVNPGGQFGVTDLDFVNVNDPMLGYQGILVVDFTERFFNFNQEVSFSDSGEIVLTGGRTFEQVFNPGSYFISDGDVIIAPGQHRLNISVSAVPEPSSFVLITIGLMIGLGWRTLRRSDDAVPLCVHLGG